MEGDFFATKGDLFIVKGSPSREKQICLATNKGRGLGQTR